MNVKYYNTGSFNVKELFNVIKYKILYSLDNPDFFSPCGIWLFTGKQGKGKTLSLMNALVNVCRQYPQAIICTDMDIDISLFGLENEIIPYTDYSQIYDLKNGIYGVIFVFDEIQVIYNCMETRGVPVSELACFCQNRKDRRLVLATTQKSNRTAKEIREQCSYVIKCDNYFQVLQKNTIIEPDDDNEIGKDGKIQGAVIGRCYFFHTLNLYNCYNTYNKIEKPKRLLRRS